MLASRPLYPQEVWIRIVNNIGDPWADCCKENEELLRQQYDAAYPKDAPFRVVELFYEEKDSQNDT